MVPLSPPKPQLISLFCGPGGLDEGFKQAGFETRLAYDHQAHCVNTHRLNHPEAEALVEDLAEITLNDLMTEWGKRSDQRPVGLIGGPPCQAFSFANVHKKEDDSRAQLVDVYAELISGLGGKDGIQFFVFENVTGLLGERHKSVFNDFKQKAQAAGFAIKDEILDAAHFGVPQYRKRVFVVGVNEEVHPGVRYRFPQGDPEHVVCAEDVIRGLPEPAFFRRSLTPDDIPYHPNHWCMRPRSIRFTDGSITPGDSVTSRSFRALAWGRPSFTVAYGNREVHVHPNCKRRLSVYEAMCLQGFTKSYQLLGTLSDQISMVSDAVAPPVAKALAVNLINQLQLSVSAEIEA